MLLDSWQQKPDEVKCCFTRREMTPEGLVSVPEAYLSDYLYGVGRMVTYRSSADSSSHLISIYEGQYLGSFSGFGRYVY